MWVLGHLGFASAIFAVGARVSAKRWDGETGARAFRWFLLGSLLPDLVDKPVGRVILGEHFQNGRIYFHTLLVLLLFLAAGFLLHRVRDARFLAISAGMAVHLLLDAIWAFPETALWPLLGPFPRFPEEGSFWQYLVEQFRNPMVVATELSGLAALLLSLVALGYGSPGRALRLLFPVGWGKGAQGVASTGGNSLSREPDVGSPGGAGNGASPGNHRPYALCPRGWGRLKSNDAATGRRRGRNSPGGDEVT
jgi:hypothetical protein